MLAGLALGTWINAVSAGGHEREHSTSFDLLVGKGWSRHAGEVSGWLEIPAGSPDGGLPVSGFGSVIGYGTLSSAIVRYGNDGWEADDLRARILVWIPDTVVPGPRPERITAAIWNPDDKRYDHTFESPLVQGTGPNVDLTTLLVSEPYDGDYPEWKEGDLVRITFHWTGDGAAALGAPVDHARGGIACGVHYKGSVADATRHFEGAGFSGIRDVSVLDTYEQGQSSYNCNLMRERARAHDAAGECLSFYQGPADWSDATCSVYRFAYDRYTGPIGDLGRR